MKYMRAVSINIIFDREGMLKFVVSANYSSVPEGVAMLYDECPT